MNTGELLKLVYRHFQKGVAITKAKFSPKMISSKKIF